MIKSSFLSPFRRVLGQSAALSVVLIATVGSESAEADAATPQGDPIAVLLAAGDIAACYRSGSRFAEMAQRIQEEVIRAQAAGIGDVGILVLGDLAYRDPVDNNPTYATCFDRFKETWGQIEGANVFPVPGNHDYSDDTPQHYRDYFSQRLQELGANAAMSYAVQFPPNSNQAWTLVGFNYYGGVGSQLAWLRENLADASGCALVFTHPFYNSSGNHGQNEGGEFAEMRPVFAAMVEQSASVFIAAHDHNFEQFARGNAQGQPSSSGVRQFVVGTGGASLYRVSHKPGWDAHPLSEYFEDTLYGFLRITLYADSYSWSLLTVDGKEVPLPVQHDVCGT